MLAYIEYERGLMLESAIYRVRFSGEELRKQRELWGPIAQFLQRYVPPGGAVLDLGAGFCHFINNIRSEKKIAVDINEENLRAFADPDVRCIVSEGSNLSGVASSSIDTAFASNVYEHFQSREAVAASFAEVHRALRPGGRFVIMQPNFAHCSKSYFDFFDHRLIFTHKGVAEGLVSAGFEVLEAIDRFLPYTSKSKLPAAPWIVALYLRLRPAWKIFGSQMLVVARKN